MSSDLGSKPNFCEVADLRKENNENEKKHLLFVKK